MEPIQPIHIGGTNNLGGIQDVAQTSTPIARGGGDAGGVSGVTTAVTDMLNSIGGGLENDQMLKAMIALMIIAAMLQQLLEGEFSSNESLRALGNGRGEVPQGMAMNASFVSIEYTSISINSTSITQSSDGASTGQEPGSQLDISS